MGECRSLADTPAILCQIWLSIRGSPEDYLDNLLACDSIFFKWEQWLGQCPIRQSGTWRKLLHRMLVQCGQWHKSKALPRQLIAAYGSSGRFNSTMKKADTLGKESIVTSQQTVAQLSRVLWHEA